MDTQSYPPKSITGTRYKETIPIPEGATKYTYWDTKEVYDLATAIRTAKDFGGPNVTAEDLVNRMLVEGRSDAGANEYNRDNKTARKLFLNMLDSGASDKSATFVAAMLDKLAVAKRLGKPLDEVWNGTGTSKYGKTGKDYAVRMEQSKPAATAPQNTQLLDYVKRAISGNLTTPEVLTQKLPAIEFQRMIPNGDLYNLYDKLAWNHDYKDPQQKAVIETLSSLTKLPINKVHGMDPARMAATQAVLNSYRADQGVAPREANISMDATSKTVADILATNPTFKAMFNSLGLK